MRMLGKERVVVRRSSITCVRRKRNAMKRIRRVLSFLVCKSGDGEWKMWSGNVLRVWRREDIRTTNGLEKGKKEEWRIVIDS